MNENEIQQFTVVRFVAETKPHCDFAKDKLYAVETNTDLVDIFDDGTITAWNDEGFLAEMNQGEFEVVSVGEDEWFEVKPERTYVEQN